MKTPNKQIRTAARARAAGKSWAATAVIVKRSIKIVCKWPDLYPMEWARHLEQAQREIQEEAASEAVAKLRLQLRDKKPEIGAGAAKTLLLWAKQPAKTPREVDLSEDELSRRLVESLSGGQIETLRQVLEEPDPADELAGGGMILEHSLTRQVQRARHDVNQFARLCFRDSAGQSLRPATIHRQLQQHLSDYPRALIELPRDHGKSVQMCIRLVWELGRRPGLRIKIVCATESVAMERGRFIREAIVNNPLVKRVFPYLLRSQPWEVERFTVRRPGSVIGPSVACLGVGVRATGTRADLLVCDDIVDVTALRSRVDRERVKTYFRENLVNLLEPDGRLWYIFTPWHTDDLSAELKRNDLYAHFRRSISANLESIWPAHWPTERLAQRRREIGEVAFARAYRLESVPDGEVAIRPEWVRTWNEPTAYETIILAVDPATGRKNDGDNTGLVALGRTMDGVVHCLEAIARRVSAPELIRLIETADMRWKPDAILFESNGAFAALRDLLSVHAKFGAKLRPIVQTKDKLSRIRLFGVHVEGGRFQLHGGDDGIDSRQSNLFDEMTTFPLGEHDDLVDAAAFGTSWLLDRPSPRVW